MKTLHLEKNGIRGLSISESFTKQDKYSVLAGVVMSNEFQIDGFIFGRATIRGDDITQQIITMYEKLNRDDISYVLLPGTILSMYNIVDIEKIYDYLQIPIIAINSQDCRPSRFIKSDLIDAAISELKYERRQVTLSIKLLEEIQKKDNFETLVWQIQKAIVKH